MVEHHQWHPAVAATHRGAVLARRHVEDAEHLVLGEHAEVALFLLHSRLAVAHDHEHPGRARHVLDAARDVGEERVGDVGHDQPDRAALSAAQLAGRFVAYVVEAVDRLLDPPEGRVGDEIGPVERVRHGAHRHAGVTGDVADAGPVGHRRSAIDTVRIGAYHTRIESVQLNRFTSWGSAKQERRSMLRIDAEGVE